MLRPQLTVLALYRLALAQLVLVSLGGCYSAPEMDAPRQPLTSLQRVFAHDLSTSGMHARVQGAQSTLSVLSREPLRLAHVTSAPARMGTAGIARVGTVPAKVSTLVGGELARVPGPAELAALSPSLPAPSQHFGDDVARTASRLGTAPAPLGEIDDVRHRTDPEDDRPEASLWARLMRRLGL